MKKFFVFLALLIVVAGCAQQTGPVEKTETQQTIPAEAPEQDTTPETTTTPDVIDIEETDTYVLSDEIKNAINDQLVPGVRAVIPLKYSKLKYGEAAVFGIGLQNIKNADDRFQIKVTFDKAQDRMMNPISVDEDSMNSWVKTNLEEFIIGSHEMEIISVVIEAGGIKPGVKPAPGAYIFDVETLTAEGGHFVSKDYIGKEEFTIKVG